MRRELQNEIELELILGQKTVAIHATKECGTLENTFGIFGIEGEKSTCGLSELGQGILTAPDFALASEAVLAHELELGVEALLLEGTAGGLVCLPVVSVNGVVGHDLDLIFKWY